jgi:hypothetical protein
MRVNISQEQLFSEIYRKNAAPQNRAQTLCKPAQVTCTSTIHKSHFTQKFTGRKCRAPKPRRRLCASLRHQNALKFNISQVTLYTEIYRKNAAPQREHPDQAPAFTP